MVQDLTTSLDHFETFALSEMTKKQPAKNVLLSSLKPQFLTNQRYSTHPTVNYDIATSLTTDPLSTSEVSILKDWLWSPRRSNRIANQVTINYNENFHTQRTLIKASRIPKTKKKANSKQRQCTSKTNRLKEIKKLFKKPSNNIIDRKNSRSKNKTKTSSKRRRRRENSSNLNISIPLTVITTSTSSTVAKRRGLELLKNVRNIKPEHSNFSIIEISNEYKHDPLKSQSLFENKIQNGQKNIKEVPEEYQQQFSHLTTNKELTSKKFPTDEERKFYNFGLTSMFENSFSGKFETFKYNSNSVFVDLSMDKEIAKNKLNGFKDKTLIEGTKPKHNKVKELFKRNDQQRCLDDLLEVSEECGKSGNWNSQQKGDEDFQMKEEISNKLNQEYLKECVSKDSEYFHADISHKLNIRKEARIEPMNLTKMDVSSEAWKHIKLGNEEVPIKSTEIMETSNEMSSSKLNNSNKHFNSIHKNNVSILYLLKKRELPYWNLIRNRPFEGTSLPTNQAIEESLRLSDNLSTMKISEHSKESSESEAVSDQNVRQVVFCDTRIQDPTDKEVGNIVTQASNEQPSDNATEFLETYQSTFSNSPEIEVLDVNELTIDEGSNEEEMIEDIKSFSDEHKSDKKIYPQLKETSIDFENLPTETITNEVQICEDSNDSEIEVIEVDASSNDSKNLDANRNSEDNVEMLWPQGYQRLFQQQYIEIHEYNCLPLPNYQHSRYEYPIVEETKFNNRPTNLSFQGQHCYGDDIREVPQFHYFDNNNYRMQIFPRNNYKEAGKNHLTITEYCDNSNEEQKENEEEQNRLENVDTNYCGKNINLQIQARSNDGQNKFLVLSQPPPIQFSYEQQRHQSCFPIQNMIPQVNQFDSFQCDNQIGQIGNYQQLQEYYQNICDATPSNDWQQNVSNKTSGQTTNSKQREDIQLHENNTFSIRDLSLDNNEPNTSESMVLERFHQDHSYQSSETQIIPRGHQMISQKALGKDLQSMAQITETLRKNCRVHDVKFGQIKSLNGRLYRTGSLLITFGDHYQVQIIGDLILKNSNDNIAFDAFFRPYSQWQ